MTKTQFHEATVTGRRMLTPGMVRLTFSGEGLASFRSTGIGDEYIRLFFPDAATGELTLPVIDDDGRWSFPDDKPPRYSTYTVRRFDEARCELDVDFVVHSGGLASEWAQAVDAGDRIVINSPRGLYEPPAGLRWQLLLADATGLPALARLLEQTPPEVASRVFIEVAEEAHEQALPHHPRARVTWLHGSGNGISPSRLARLFPQVPLPPERGYLWAAAEQTAIRAIRRHARALPAFQDGRSKLIAYWIDEHARRDRGAPAHDDGLGDQARSDWSDLPA